MKINATSKFITLDWDNINLDEALAMFNEINSSPNVLHSKLSRSSTKGYHCRIRFVFPVSVARCRFSLGDDPRRILHDLFNRPDHIHDILWTRKTIDSIPFEAKDIITYKNPAFYGQKDQNCISGSNVSGYHVGPLRLGSF